MKLMKCAIFLVVAASGCNTKQTSEPLSLDNLGAKDFSVNSCQGTNKVSDADINMLYQAQSITGAHRHLGDVRNALSALPPKLTRLYFDMGHVVSISASAPRTCASRSSNVIDLSDRDGKKAASSCLIVNAVRAPGGNLVEKYTIVLPENGASIGHGLVRAMGFVLSSVVPKIDVGSDGKVFLGMEPTEVASFKDELAKKVSEETGQAVSKERAFSEAFDSFYCSASTRAKMEEKFPASFALFQSADGAVKDLVEAEYQLPWSAELAASEGASLTCGRGFFPRICLRAAFPRISARIQRIRSLRAQGILFPRIQCGIFLQRCR